MTTQEVKQEVKRLVITKGLANINGYDFTALVNRGATGTQVQNAINYFRFSPQAAKYR